MKASGLGEATVLGTVDPSGTEVGAEATEVAEVEAEGQEAVKLLGRKVGGTEVRAEAEAEAEVAASQNRRGRPAANSLRQILGGHSARTTLYQGQRQHLAVWRLAVGAGADAGAGRGAGGVAVRGPLLVPVEVEARASVAPRRRGSSKSTQAWRARVACTRAAPCRSMMQEAGSW